MRFTDIVGGPGGRLVIQFVSLENGDLRTATRLPRGIELDREGEVVFCAVVSDR